MNVAGVPKGYKQADTHRLRIQKTWREKAIRSLDQRYTARRRELVARLDQAKEELERAEARERVEKAEAAKAETAVAS